MTEEKMAEEYSKSVCAWIEDREPLDERDIQQAFLAGLEAGRPKWHDLRKDSNDLPLRRCIDNNSNVVGLFRHSWDKKSTWYRYDFEEGAWCQMETEPIAWCEIPKYTEG